MWQSEEKEKVLPQCEPNKKKNSVCESKENNKTFFSHETYKRNKNRIFSWERPFECHNH